MTYLNCPRCRLSMPEPRFQTLAPEYCPRCIAKRQRATPMFRSPLTMGQLVADGDSSPNGASGPAG